MKARSERMVAKPDYVLSILVAVLVVVGLIMISSASVVMSKTVAGRANHYLITQMVSALIGVFALYVGAKIDYSYWKKVAPILLVLNIVALVAVFTLILKP